MTGKLYAAITFLFSAEAETNMEIPEMEMEVDIVRTEYKTNTVQIHTDVKQKVCQNFKTCSNNTEKRNQECCIENSNSSENFKILVKHS